MVLAHEICLITENVKEMVNFYEKVLQAKAEGDEIHSVISVNGGVLAIYSKAAAIQDMGFNFDHFNGTGRFTFGFMVEDVDWQYERLKAMELEIEFVKKPTTYPWGARTMHFRDPDVNIAFFKTRIG